MKKSLIVGAFICVLSACGGGQGDSKPVVENSNSAPVANAGIDQNVMVSDVVSVDASSSNDPDNDQLTYAWQFIKKPDISQAILTSTTTKTPSFNADTDGVFELSLTVSDGKLSSEKDSVVITVNKPNTQPLANAGRDQNIAINSTVWLDGSNSSDAESQSLDYQWQFITKPSGSIAELVNANSVTPNFSIDLAGDYEIELLVDDGIVESQPDIVVITSTAENSTPVAHAGDDQNLKVDSIVQLNGSNSSDADNDTISFLWDFVQEPENSQAQLSSSSIKKPIFVASTPGLYILSLTVSDDLSTSEIDLVEILVSNENSIPVADAGIDQQLKLNEIVYLSGSNSADADGDDLSYQWTFVSRPENSNAAFNDPSLIEPNFTLDLEGEYVAKLLVTDPSNASSSDTIVVTVVSESTMLTGVITGALVNAQNEVLSNIALKVDGVDITTDNNGEFSRVLQVLENDSILVEIVDESVPYMSVMSTKIIKNTNITDYDFNLSLFTQKIPVFKSLGLQLYRCSNWPGRYYNGPDNIDVTFTLIEHESVSFTTDYQMTKSFEVDGQAQEFSLPANAKYQVNIDGYNISELVEEAYGEYIDYTHDTPEGSINYMSAIVCDKR